MTLARLLGLPLIGLTCAASVAATPPPSCLAAAELDAVVSVVAPAAITAAAARCRPSLPGDAYLGRSGEALAARLRPLAAAAVPAARAAFARISGLALPPSATGDTLLAVVDAGVADALASALKPADCARLDRLLAALDPLPPRNFTRVAASLLDLGLAAKDAGIRACPGGAPR